MSKKVFTSAFSWVIILTYQTKGGKCPMVDTEKLQKTLTENKLTQQELADQMGLHPTTFSRKLRHGDFLLSEITYMLEHLIFRIDPMEIFFKGVNPTVIMDLSLKYKKKKYRQLDVFGKPV